MQGRCLRAGLLRKEEGAILLYCLACPTHVSGSVEAPQYRHAQQQRHTLKNDRGGLLRGMVCS